MPGHIHRYQQKQRHGIGGIGKAHPDPHIDGGRDRQDEKADDEFGKLRQRPGMKMPARH